MKTENIGEQACHKMKEHCMSDKFMRSLTDIMSSSLSPGGEIPGGAGEQGSRADSERVERTQRET